MDIIKSVEHEQLKNKIPELRVGNTVRVHQRIKEGNRERVQVFEGIIIKKTGWRSKCYIYCKKNCLWSRCRKNIYGSFSNGRKSRSSKSR